VYMYMRDPASDAEPLRHGRLLWAGLAVATVLTIVAGLFPTPVYDSAGEAAQALPQEVTQASN
jgi:NADH:ubiquinone oxidoreductase subunit 2 (subunit N)